MIEFVLYVCLSAAGPAVQACKEVVPPQPDDLTTMSCPRAGMMAAAKWGMEHPQYDVLGIRCGEHQEKL
jgi:hypothetical protein